MMKEIERVRQLWTKMTEAERLLWQQLRRRQLNGFRFRRQHPMGPFIVDFVSHEAGLIIELDGGQHVDNSVYDAKRERWFLQQGYLAKRYWNHQIFNQLNAVLAEIDGAFISLANVKGMRRE